MTTLFGTNLTGANRGNRVGRNFSVLSVSSCSNPAVLGTVGPEDTTDISTLKPDITGEDKKGGVVEIDFNLANSEGVNIYSRRDGDADFKFLACRAEVRRRRARDTSPTYVENPDASGLVAAKPELREYKAVFVVGDVEASQFSDEITVNCAPLV